MYRGRGRNTKGSVFGEARVVGVGFWGVLKVGTQALPFADSEWGSQELVGPSLVPGRLADLKVGQSMEEDPKSAGRIGCATDGNFLIFCAGGMVSEWTSWGIRCGRRW